MTNFRSALMFSASAIGMVWAAPALAAQTVPAAQSASTATSSAQDVNSQDIIVTAQKRTQLLIDVPQSISVVSGATLEHQQANSFEDYLKLVPGLQLNQSTPGSGRLILRGVNTGGVASTVAVYADETPFGSSSGLANGAVLAGDFDTFDVARIEVLRGPQGTIYGASSLGGVLKFVTNTPQLDKLAIRGRIGAETTAGGEMGYLGNGMINVPLSPALAFRGSVYYRRQGGFIDSIGTAGSDREKNINRSDSYGERASLLFKPGSVFSLRLSAIFQNINSGAPSVVESDPVTLNTLYGGLTQSQYVPLFSHLKYRVYNATANLDLGFGNLTSSTSKSNQRQTFRQDTTTRYSPVLQFFFGAANDSYIGQINDVSRFSQELRLSGHSSAIDWLIGGYYDREKGLVRQHLQGVVPNTLTPVATFPQLADIDLRSVYREQAGFANATVHFGPMFDIDLGGRYSHNAQRATQIGAGLLGGGVIPETRSSENVFTYSVAPKVKFGRNMSLYARVAKGFRPGGPNVLPPAAPASTPRTYRSDSLISYEAGIKAQSENRMFSVDASVFHLDWKNIQLLAAVNGFGVNTNAGKAKSDGAEITGTVRPMVGLDLSANAAYTNARLSEDTPAIVGGRSGDKLPFTPRYSVGLNGDYSFPVGAGSKAFLGASLRYLAKQYGEYDAAYRTTYGHQRQLPSYTVIDLRGGLDFGKVELEAYAKNVGNSHGKTSTSSAGLYPAGAIATGVIRPRTIGLTLTASY
ncbi:TonB-dependent receptor [Sphingomonas sp. RB1R13]|uniref:TonB-dependent receptor n=1 Tax=Sphingomonas sp. RB1R13 TaxID=3096159 RepID=UPI002FC65ACE